MNIKSQFKGLNTLGLIFLLGSTIISSIVIWAITFILQLIIFFISIFDFFGILGYYGSYFMNPSAYIFLNISLILLGLILIIKDLKTNSK